jgi:hypothetical protein
MPRIFILNSLRLFDVTCHQLVPVEAAMRPHRRSPCCCVHHLNSTSAARSITALRMAARHQRISAIQIAVS